MVRYYNIYDVSIYDLLRSEQFSPGHFEPDGVIEGMTEEQVRNYVDEQKREVEVRMRYKNILTEQNELTMQNRLNELENALNITKDENQILRQAGIDVYSHGLEIGKYYGYALSSMPFIGRNYDKIAGNQEKLETRTENLIDILVENDQMALTMGNTLLTPLYKETIEENIDKVLELQKQENVDILDKGHYDREKMQAIEKNITETQTRVKELEALMDLIKPSEKQINIYHELEKAYQDISDKVKNTNKPTRKMYNDQINAKNALDKFVNDTKIKNESIVDYFKYQESVKALNTDITKWKSKIPSIKERVKNTIDKKLKESESIIDPLFKWVSIGQNAVFTPSYSYAKTINNKLFNNENLYNEIGKRTKTIFNNYKTKRNK